MTNDSARDERIGGIAHSTLVAYADGALPPEQAREVEAAIVDNPEAQEALALMRQSAAAARHALDDPLNEPVPERLRALFDVPRRPLPLSRRLLPLAASILALAVGMGAGYFAGRTTESDGALRLAGAPAASATHAFDAAMLQALAGGSSSVTYSDPAAALSGTVTLIGAVETSFGITCREFRDVRRAGNESETTQSGLACQRPDGGWEVTILDAAPR